MIAIYYWIIVLYVKLCACVKECRVKRKWFNSIILFPTHTQRALRARRTTPWKEKKTKFVKLVKRMTKEKEEEKPQAQTDTTGEDSTEQISKEEPFAEGINVLDGVGQKYQDLLSARAN
jgi:hypothetical protein